MHINAVQIQTSSNLASYILSSVTAKVIVESLAVNAEYHGSSGLSTLLELLEEVHHSFLIHHQ